MAIYFGHKIYDCPYHKVKENFYHHQSRPKLFKALGEFKIICMVVSNCA